MKIAIDPGHGFANRLPNVFDPGATARAGTEMFAEADIALRYGHTLRSVFESAGIEVFMTRTSSADAAPLGGRATRARNANCTHLLSLHLNAFTNPQANGVEVQFRDNAKDRPLADRIQRRLLLVTGLSDHGNDQRNIPILRFPPGPAILIELGFITNPGDRNFLLRGENRDAICRAIFEVVTT